MTRTLTYRFMVTTFLGIVTFLCLMSGCLSGRGGRLISFKELFSYVEVSAIDDSRLEFRFMPYANSFEPVSDYSLRIEEKDNGRQVYLTLYWGISKRLASSFNDRDDGVVELRVDGFVLDPKTDVFWYKDERGDHRIPIAHTL